MKRSSMLIVAAVLLTAVGSVLWIALRSDSIEDADRSVLEGKAPTASSLVTDPPQVVTPIRVPAPVPRETLSGRLVGLDPNIPWRTPVLVEPVEPDEAAAAIDAAVDPDGGFELDLAAVGHQRPLELRVIADDPGYLPAEVLVTLRATEPTPFVELQVTPASALMGIVIDGSGDPVPGAHVGCFTMIEGRPARTARPQAITDAQGQYSLRLDLEGSVVVLATASGALELDRVAHRWRIRPGLDLLPASVTVSLARGTTAQAPPLVLRHGLSITGVVVDGAGRPVPDARITAHRDGHSRPAEKRAITRLLGPSLVEFAEETVAPRMVPAVSDARGEFRLEGLDDSDWELTVAAVDGVVTSMGIRKSLRRTVRAPQDHVQFVLVAACIELEVRHGDAPATGAVVFVRNGESGWTWKMNTNDTGHGLGPDGLAAMLVEPERTYVYSVSHAGRRFGRQMNARGPGETTSEVLEVAVSTERGR